MSSRACDIAIVGGGLSGGLIAMALALHRPELRVLLLESGTEPGGNHRWSWFASDLSPAGTALMHPFRKVEWAEGYEVGFPGLLRHLSSPYRSLSSVDFAAALRRTLAPDSIRTRCQVVALDAAGVDLADGPRILARAVIDCRGQVASPHLTGGWQLFMGRHLRTPQPHGVRHPVIMDAAVEQHGAYRFVYTLPLGASDLFVEDTYYADSPVLDRSALSGRIDAYCNRSGWQGDIIGHETGVLPVITGGNFAKFQAQARIEGVGRAGACGGFTHPLTSYSLPYAVETALAIVAEADLPGAQLAALLDARARAHWQATGFYRLLGKMLFGAALPDERYRIFERFYGLSEPLIERFYAGRSTLADKARILCGRPPVPVLRAIPALLARGNPLLERTVP
jgi:lycopene beta-cyclase